MMPGETDVLPENKLTIIANIAATRQCALSFRSKICSVACRHAEVPRFVWPEPETSVESWMIKADLCEAPRFRPRRERSVFHFSRIIEFAESTRDRYTARIIRTPN